MLNRIDVQNDPVNFVDPIGLAAFYNRSSYPVRVSGGSGSDAAGHSGGSQVSVVVPPGGIVDKCNPAYDENGNGPLVDVDSYDRNGDDVAEVPSGMKDAYFFGGEKLPGNDGFGYAVYDNPFGDGPFLFPFPFFPDDCEKEQQSDPEGVAP